MKKLILFKINFSKAIFIKTASKLLSNPKIKSTIFINNTKLIILNKTLMDLLDNDSSSASGVTSTIIGKIDYKKLKEQNKAKNQKGISQPNTKIPSKIIVLNTEIQQTAKEKIQPKKIKKANQKENIEIKPSNNPASIRISEQKNLFSKTITITPNISPKKRAIINASIKKKEETQKQPKQSNKNENTKTSVKSVNPVKPATEKKPKIPNIKNQTNETHLPKKESPKQNITSKPVTKIVTTQPAKINQAKSKPPKYKLQRKSPSVIAAIFSAISASILFGLGLVISHKKNFHSTLIASSLAVLGFGMFANNTKTKNKQLVKTNKKTY